MSLILFLASQLSDQELIETTRSMILASNMQFLAQTHCHDCINFDSLEKFFEAAEIPNREWQDFIRNWRSSDPPSELQVRRKKFDSKKMSVFKSLLRRDGFKCRVPFCDSQDIGIDHITPISKGGTDDLENLQFLCKRHNSVKGTRVMTIEQLAVA